VKNLFSSLPLFLLSLGAIAGLHAQSASLHGRVTDESGAVVPRATVTVTSEQTAAQSTTGGRTRLLFVSQPSSRKLPSAGFRARALATRAIGHRSKARRPGARSGASRGRQDAADHSPSGHRPHARHRPGFERQLRGDRRRRSRCALRRSRRPAGRLTGFGRAVGWSQWRIDLCGWIQRRGSAGQECHS